MEKQILNLFIVDENRLMAAGLEQYIQNRFGDRISISIFYDGESCLKEVTNTTHIVILDYFMKVKDGLKILESIKNINPETEVILLSNQKEIGAAIESYIGAWDSIMTSSGILRKFTGMIRSLFKEPLIIIRVVGLLKFVTMFLLTFTTIGVLVFLILYLLPR